MPARSSLPPALEIRLLGRFAVSVRGQPVDERRWERRSAKALVKLLSMSPPHAMHREQIIETLWPGLSPPAGVNTLNKAIHAARRALEPDLKRGGRSGFILTPTDQVVLSSPDGLQVDVLQFEGAAQRAAQHRDLPAAHQALALYGGELLIDDLYEPWTFARRTWARRLFRATALEAARWLSQAGETAQAIVLAQRLLLEDAADEPVHTLLVQLHAAAGRADEALRQAEQARRALLAAGSRASAALLSLEQALRQPGLPAAERGDSWAAEAVAVTFRSGVIRTVRAAAQTAQVVMNADWGGGSLALRRQGVGGEEAQPLPWRGVELFALSPPGHVVLGIHPRFRNPWTDVCTLVVAPADGGPCTEVLPAVCGADWHPRSPPPDAHGGTMTGGLAVAREVDGRAVVEFPIGVRRFQSRGWVSHLRCSPCGRWLAFLDHPIENDDAGEVLLVDLRAPGMDAHATRHTPVRTLATGLASVQGLAWFQGDLWFTATRSSAPRALWRVGLRGELTRVLQESRVLTLHDALPGQGLLMTMDRQSVKMMVRRAGDAESQDISWHELTWPRDISSDGQWLLVEELQVAGRQPFAAYLRKTDGTLTRKVADGLPVVLSPDATRAIIRTSAGNGQLAELDLASARLTPLPRDHEGRLTYSEFVSYFPDGQRIAFVAGDVQHGPGLYVQDLPAGVPVRFESALPGVRMLWNRAVSPDGQTLMLLGADDLLWMYPADGRPATPLTALGTGWLLVSWHAGGQAIFVQGRGARAGQVARYHLATGVLTAWMTLSQPGTASARSVRRLRMTADGQTCAYGLESTLSDLYLLRNEQPPAVAQDALRQARRPAAATSTWPRPAPPAA